MPYNEALADRIRAALGARSLDFEEKRMFGGLTFMVGGNMTVGVTQDELMARVGPDAHAAALQRPGARPMEFTGRSMQGFVFVSPAGYESDADLASWLDTTLAYTPKKPKSTARRRPAKS